jgi:hypothetical protein
LVERFGVHDAEEDRAVAWRIFNLLDTMIHRQILETKVTPSDKELVDFLADVAFAYLGGLS